MTDTAATPDITDTELTPNDRRALLRKLAIGGAGAAAGAVMLSNGRASAASTVNGEEITAGDLNLSTAPTRLVMDPSDSVGETGPSSLSVSNAATNWATAPFPANVGGYGDTEVLHGLHGSTTAAGGFGVVAANFADEAAAATDPVPTAQAFASPNGAHLLLLAGDNSGPTEGLHLAGELYVDADGTLWFTVPTATADVVRFVKLAGEPTSGSFHAIDPQRVYDSRQAGYPAALQGVMAPDTNRVISVADGRSATGVVTLENAVPDGATAVQINLTAAQGTGSNFLAVTAGDVATTATSAVNWNGAGAQIANALTVPLSSDREIRVYCGDQTGSTHVIVDVFGYYL